MTQNEYSANFYMNSNIFEKEKFSKARNYYFLVYLVSWGLELNCRLERENIIWLKETYILVYFNGSIVVCRAKKKQTFQL